MILVGTDIDRELDMEESLVELERLVETAGGSVVGRIVQRREKPDVSSLMAGKAGGTEVVAAGECCNANRV